MLMQIAQDRGVAVVPGHRWSGARTGAPDPVRTASPHVDRSAEANCWRAAGQAGEGAETGQRKERGCALSGRKRPATLCVPSFDAVLGAASAAVPFFADRPVNGRHWLYTRLGLEVPQVEAIGAFVGPDGPPSSGLKA